MFTGGSDSHGFRKGEVCVNNKTIQPFLSFFFVKCRKNSFACLRYCKGRPSQRINLKSDICEI